MQEIELKPKRTGEHDMQKYFEKIIERLEEEVAYQSSKADAAGKTCAFEEIPVVKAREKMAECYEHAIEIINQVAEEYNKTAKMVVNEEIKNVFANVSTVGCVNCDHKDEYIIELEKYVEEIKSNADKGGEVMSMINEQIERLRNLSKTFEDSGWAVDGLVKEFRCAANTIEELSAKLAAANMERSTAYYNDGWIPVSERLPEDGAIHECTAVFNNGIKYIEHAYYNLAIEEWWSHDDTGLVNVIAWQPLPAPYQPKGETE